MTKREPVRHFRDQKITPVHRRWMCAADCSGEMKRTGQGMTTMEISWQHRCDKCGREEWAGTNYPRVAYLPIEKIEAEHD